MSSVCVHGLGYIGLPTAVVMANFGHQVTGYDVDESLRDRLRSGDVPVEEPGLQAYFTRAIDAGSLEIADTVVAAKYHVICVPTPLDESSQRANLDAVREATRSVASELRHGDTVILESTVPPGTTLREVKPILESAGLVAGSDFALVHCPETVLPGDIVRELRENDRILGGVNGLCTESAVRLYSSFVEGEITTVGDPTLAEIAKLLQNTYRDTNIALANEIAKLGDEYGIDAREAIELANTHPRVEIHQPGPGVGGHCLPIDPWFLGHGSGTPELIAHAREVNDGMAGYVVDTLEESLEEPDDARIAILGIAYKGDVDDARQSPGLSVAKTVQARRSSLATPDGGAQMDSHVSFHDPHVTDADVPLVGLESALAGADAAVITTDHEVFEEFDPETFRDQMAGNVIYDTRNIIDPDRWRTAGFRVLTL